MKNKMAMHTRGFSLIELSIVLVILGLLTGGILAGQSLIRAAELRSISSDMTRYVAANNTFRDKYFGLPGDITNGYQFWPGKSMCQSNSVVLQTNPNGCNGNGDGIINLYTGEFHRFWMHLSLAGLIEGNYNGYFPDWGAGSPLDTIYPGTNTPRSKYGQNAFFLTYNLALSWRGFTSGPNLNTARNRLMFANLTGTALPTPEAWNIDTKMDDGKPGLGGVTAYAYCAVSGNTNTGTAEYDLSTANSTCAGLDIVLN
jgi:prepilin-type N-terminal cleavage/methylation domain-containing protein